MIKLKQFISIAVAVIVTLTIIINYDKITNRLTEFTSNYIKKERKIDIQPGNEYTKNTSYEFVQQTTNFKPNSYKDLINIFYTTLDKGWKEFTFYCDDNYTSCLNDIDEISHNEILLSNINNYVHPFNSYTSINVIYDDSGEIKIKITPTYTDEDIEKINNKIDSIEKQILNDSMDTNTKILTIHDYIINNTKYDLDKANNKSSQYDSTRINGVLFEGYGICSGYTDTMAVFLNRLNIDNFKISSSNHIWNAIKYNNTWLHLDLTWDDPVDYNNPQSNDTLSHDFFLIPTNKLKANDTETDNHNFDNQYYLYFN